MAEGHKPYGLYIDGRLAHYTIYGHGVAPGPAGLVVRIDPRYLYVYRTFTHPEFRGRHLLEVRSYLIRRHWDGPLFEGSASYIALHNLASAAMAERIGETVVGYAGFLPRGKTRKVFFRTRGAKARGFEFDYPTPAEQRLLSGA